MVVHNDQAPDQSRGRVQSVKRAIAILEAVGFDQRDVGIVELSHRVDLPVSTVHRILATLGDGGYVVQNPETGHYRIGVRAFEIGNTFLMQTQLLEVARPGMKDLAACVNETVNLAIREGNHAVYIDQVESTHFLKMFTQIGTRVNLYCTGVGKVLLVGNSNADIDDYLASVELLPRTPRTITDRTLLKQHLDLVRQQGYALDDEEVESGVRCIAAPVRDHRGDTVAAISLSGPARRMTNGHLQQLTNNLIETAGRISRQLGYAQSAHGDQDKRRHHMKR